MGSGASLRRKPAQAPVAAQISSLPDLFGDTLLTREGDTLFVQHTPVEVLSGATAVGIYFSARSCAACRDFTAKLAEMYTSTFEEKGMRIVFVSSDKDESSFQEYFNEMPWAAVLFSNQALKDSLAKKFDAASVPKLVIVDPGGELITTDGKAAITADPEGDNYPWSQEVMKYTICDALGKDLIGQAKGKPIGLYFAAKSCPACCSFTSQLAQWYKDGLNRKVEIVFVSSDADQASFGGHFKEMPWKALPFEKRAQKDVLVKACGIQTVPALSLINSDGTVITHDGCAKVTGDPTGSHFPSGWAS